MRKPVAPPPARVSIAESVTGRLLARNVSWNLLGYGLPVLVAIPAVPLLIRGLGTDRFGLLALSWVVVGYSGWFDLGLGRALTQAVAQRLATGRRQELPSVIWTAMLLLFLLGVIGAIAVFLASPWLVTHVLRVPVALQPETRLAFSLLALAIPIVTSSTGLKGVLEARQAFGLVNAVRIPLGIYTFLGPLLVLPISHSLVATMAALIAGRVVSWVAQLLLCLRIMPALRRPVLGDAEATVALLRYGGWLTITNLISPIMVYLDRFVIGALISVAAVAFYATPYEVITKLSLVAGALAGVLFPTFAGAFARDRERAAFFFGRGVKYLFLFLFPVILIVVAFAHEILAAWLGADFVQHSTHVLQWLAVGVFVNNLAQLPSAFLQGAGRPDLTAKLHLIELPIYLLILYPAVTRYGIDGAAIAWTVRVTIDAALLFALSLRLLDSRAITPTRVTIVAGSPFFVLLLVFLPPSLPVRLALVALVLVGFLAFTWSVLLSAGERERARAALPAAPAFWAGG